MSGQSHNSLTGLMEKLFWEVVAIKQQCLRPTNRGKEARKKERRGFHLQITHTHTTPWHAWEGGKCWGLNSGKARQVQCKWEVQCKITSKPWDSLSPNKPNIKPKFSVFFSGLNWLNKARSFELVTTGLNLFAHDFINYTKPMCLRQSSN